MGTKTTRAVAALHAGARRLAGNFMIPADVPQALTQAAEALEEMAAELQELRELRTGGCEGCGGRG